VFSGIHLIGEAHVTGVKASQGVPMIIDSQPVLLVIDDNSSDIALLESAWMQAGHDKSIGIYSCASYRAAMVWLLKDMIPGQVISGVLVDLMLFDETGRSAVDRLSELQILKDVPVISWIGIDLGQKLTDRIRKSSTRVWRKPSNWLAWGEFIRRFHNVVDKSSTASSARYPSSM
jgi:CheY-like chemotaxis protein